MKRKKYFNNDDDLNGYEDVTDIPVIRRRIHNNEETHFKKKNKYKDLDYKEDQKHKKICHKNWLRHQDKLNDRDT